MNCKNCDQPADGSFCPHCGQKTSTERFSVKHLGHEFLHGFFHIDHGIFYTIERLILNPGKTIKEYLSGRRIHHFNPFTFIVIFGGLTALLLARLDFESFAVELGIVSRSAISETSWQQSVHHFSYRIFLGIPLYSLMTKAFYFRKDFNFSEHLIANTYLRGMTEIGFLVTGVVLLFVHSSSGIATVKALLLFSVICYYAWAFAVLFDNKLTPLSFLKGFICALTATILEIAIVNLIVLKY